MRRLVPVLVLAAVPAAAQPPLFQEAREALALARELALPPTRPGEEPVRVEQLVFAPAARREYAADETLDEVRKRPDKYPLRAKVLAAFDTVREVWARAPDLPAPKQKKAAKREKPAAFLTRAAAPVTAAFKDEVKAYQEFPATAMLKIETALAGLEEVRPLRATEPKRWQAHFDYAVAQCHSRVAFLNEYDLALGCVLREELPDLDAKAGHAGWRLVPAGKMLSKKDVREKAEAARGLFEKLAADHKGTPWADLARRELAAPPGLRWEPAAKEPLK
jgi:hypothetical protein